MTTSAVTCPEISSWTHLPRVSVRACAFATCVRASAHVRACALHVRACVCACVCIAHVSTGTHLRYITRTHAPVDSGEISRVRPTLELIPYNGVSGVSAVRSLWHRRRSGAACAHRAAPASCERLKLRTASRHGSGGCTCAEVTASRRASLLAFATTPFGMRTHDASKLYIIRATDVSFFSCFADGC